MKEVGKIKVKKVLQLSSRGKRKNLNREALSLMGIPVMYQGATWKDFNFSSEQLEKLFKGYTENCDAMFRDCVNILLYGSNGVGKTFSSSIILQYCYANYYSCRLLTFKDLISRTFNKQDMSGIINAEFVVIDELGAEVSLKSEAEKSLLEDFLKQRFAKGLPTIICTNLDLDELRRRYGNTFYSMMSEFVKVRIVGEDGRRDSFRKKEALKFLR